MHCAAAGLSACLWSSALVNMEQVDLGRSECKGRIGPEAELINHAPLSYILCLLF